MFGIALQGIVLLRMAHVEPEGTLQGNAKGPATSRTHERCRGVRISGDRGSGDCGGIGLSISAVLGKSTGKNRWQSLAVICHLKI